MPKKEYFLKQRAIIDPDGNRAGSASNLHSAFFVVANAFTSDRSHFRSSIASAVQSPFV